MDELFDPSSVAMASPRLRWCEQHRVTTTRTKKGWEAKMPRKKEVGVGPTEEEACADLGVRHGVRLWNEVV